MRIKYCMVTKSKRLSGVGPIAVYEKRIIHRTTQINSPKTVRQDIDLYNHQKFGRIKSSMWEPFKGESR